VRKRRVCAEVGRRGVGAFEEGRARSAGPAWQ
jgi:hypothetical protein